MTAIAHRAMLASQDDKSSVRARRRRPSGGSTPGQRPRARTPQRRRETPSGSSKPRPRPSGSGSSYRPSGSGGGIPLATLGRALMQRGRGPRIPLGIIIGLLVMALLCFCLYIFVLSPLFSITEISYNEPTPVRDLADPTSPPPATRTPQPFTPPAVSSDGQTWLIMMYQNADDKALEEDIFIDLNEAERVGSSEQVQVVAQVDRFRSGFQGDGNWSSTKRFYVTYDNDLERVRSQEIADLGEANMADGETLVDFAAWAIETFPADKHVLILSDHGMGWPGGWTDPAPGGKGDHDVALAAMGDELFLMEMDEALDEIRARTGLDKFELIGLDACLMGHIEVMSALAPHARYAVASQETEPAVGWAYAAFLRALSDNPNMDGAGLGQMILQSYIRQDERVVDDKARARFLGASSPMSGFFGGPSAQQLAQKLEDNTTLSLIDLETLPTLMQSLNNLAYSLSQTQQRPVASARTYAQSFTSVFGKKVPPSYIDLGNFTQLVKRETGDTKVAEAADQLLLALDQSVIAERHGPKKAGATGLSIYFPSSQLYGSRYTGPESYTTIAQRFASESLWDDFLVYHYTGRSFEPDEGAIAIPSKDALIEGPGAGVIEIDPITTSSNIAAPGQPILLSTDIRGDNIGYVYLFIGYYDQEANSIYVADTDYLESGSTREIDGVYYPDWGDSGIVSLEFEWEPIVYAIYSGQDYAMAMFNPEEYGASPEEAIYSVEGVYTFSDGSGSRYARLHFSNGVLRTIYGFVGQGDIGAPREIIPEPGDTFTVLERWMDLDAGGMTVVYASQQGDTIAMENDPWEWIELDAAAGDYIVGFIVTDLDGNAYKSQTTVTVAE